MEALIIGASVLALVLAIVMMVIATKSLRDNRARSTARVAALQTLVNTEDTEATEVAEMGTEMMEEPAFVLPPVRQHDAFDLALREHAPAQRRRVDVDVRSNSVDVRGDLFEEPAPRTPGHRWAWMAASGLVMASIVGAYFVISSGAIGRLTTANRARANATSARPIELLSLRHSVDRSGTFIVTGLVQNPTASAALPGVSAVVYLFDAEGKYFASSRAALDTAVLSPGGQSGFSVKVPSPESVSQYRVSFQEHDGAAVIHVDRRGALPAQTSGDTVQTTPASTPLVAAGKIG